MLRLFVGLGNPGKKYSNTRHNVGFNVLDRLAERYKININNIGFKGLYYKGHLFQKPVMLLKPQTYMNLSGLSVSQVVNMYKIPLDKLMVIYDDLDLPLGRIRIRLKGSAGGHNGMKSIIESIGNSKDFPRLRIGIGKSFDIEAKNHVLSRFSSDESVVIDKIINRCCDAVEQIIKTDDIVRAMNEFNAFESI